MVTAPPTSIRTKRTWATAVILLLLIVGGGWGMWRYVSNGDAAPTGPVADVPADGPAIPRMAGGNNLRQLAARMAQGVPDGIQFNGTTYLVKAGTMRMDIDRGNGANWRLRFRYTVPDLITADQTAAVRVMENVILDQTKAQAAGVKPDQIAQLRKIPPGGILVSAADRDQLKTLFIAWLAASGGPPTTAPAKRPVPALTPSATSGPTSRPAPMKTPNSPAARAAEQKLVAALDSVGKRQLGPTRQNNAKRAEQIQAILGPNLFDKLKQAG